jgi:alkylation response protein AidB-like acyl-CoA dehydrogenase
MMLDLTSRQAADRAAFRAFTDQEVVPRADQYDRRQRMPRALIRRAARQGYFGASLPPEWGGLALDWVSYGLLHEEIGRGCSSLRSLLTVHGMVSHVLLRWGGHDQKQRWLPGMAAGRLLAGFALTEPNAGSDAAGIETTATSTVDGYCLDGEKRWITGGQIADVFLVVARLGDKPVTLLVERDSPGLSISPVRDLLGLRASMLAHLRLDACHVPKENLVGRPGSGLSHVAALALDFGRYCVAWGAVGIAQACLETAARYTAQRRQFGALLKEHQLIQRMLSDMMTNLRAARLLCLRAGHLRDVGDPGALIETSIAKYFASRAAMQAASDTVQIHGANGCSSMYSPQRYLRDAKIMEIIEGPSQLHQTTIARYAWQEYGIAPGPGGNGRGPE